MEGTVRSNMDPFEEKTDDEVRRCLANAKLSAQKLSDAVETGGRNFSAGERQLLALARTLLHRRKIVVLDEPTANVDTETDNAVQEMLRKEFAERSSRQALDDLNRLGHYPRQLPGVRWKSEKLLASQLTQALQDDSVPSAVKNEIERLRHDDDAHAYQQDPKNGFVDQDLDKGSLCFNLCRPETISGVLQQAIKSWPGQLRGLRFWWCNRESYCKYQHGGASQPADWLSPIPVTFFATQLHLVAEHCPELEQLRLDYCYGFGAPDSLLCDAIEAIAKSCSRLRHLDASTSTSTSTSTSY